MSESPCRRAAGVLSAALLACVQITSAAQIIDDDPIDKSGPHVDQIARDLVGSKILYAARGSGVERIDSASLRVWTVRHGDLKRLEIIARFQAVNKGDFINRIDEVHARVTLADREQTVRGPLVLLYMQMGEQWQLVYAGPRDGNAYNSFSFERTRTQSGKLIAALSPADTAGGPSPYAPSAVNAPWDPVSSHVEQAPFTPVPDDPAGPSADQIGRDLVGRNFTYFLRGSEPNSSVSYMVGVWTVGSGELEDMRIVGRYPGLKDSYGDPVYEVQAYVTLAGCDETIRGVLAFQYMKQDAGWRLLFMGPRDGGNNHDFSFQRTRKSDGKRTVELTPANPPAGPWRYGPLPKVLTAPGPTPGTVIQFR